MSSQVVTSNTTIKLKANKFKRTGYTFTGWVITESGEAFASGEKYSVVGDVYLTATWEANDDYVNPFL